MASLNSNGQVTATHTKRNIRPNPEKFTALKRFYKNYDQQEYRKEKHIIDIQLVKY